LGAINRLGFSLQKAFNEQVGPDGRSIFLTPFFAFLNNLNSCSGYPAAKLYLPYVVHFSQGRLVKYASLFSNPACAIMTRDLFIEQALEVFAPVDFGTLRNDSSEFKERHELECRARQLQVAEHDEEQGKKIKRRAEQLEDDSLEAARKNKKQVGAGASSSSAQTYQCLAAMGIALGVRGADPCRFGAACTFIHVGVIPNPCPAAQKAEWVQALARSKDSRFKTVVLKAIQDLP
jgi:hypothetical protein